ncbi:MAG: hypothetical protein KAG61_06885 [Bacteriovoracaceae bacterium]|nr:hypothetical protein [Bacteriovoracaceae bacterium]
MKKHIDKIVLALVFELVLIGVYWARIDDPSFKHFFVREDHLVEWLTVMALLGGSALCFFRVWKLWAKKNWIFLLSTFVLGCLFFFGAGEEISWGQRILGIESSEFFKAHNAQGETNLHNLVVGGTKINKLVFGLLLGIFIAVYFLIVPLLYRKFEVVKKWINALAMPLPTWFHIACYAALFLLAEATGSGKKGELLEFGGCWIFLMMTLYPLNKENFKG